MDEIIETWPVRFARGVARRVGDLLPTAIDIFVWLALAFLIIYSFTIFIDSDSFADIATVFFSAVALVMSLTSVTFTYSMTKPDDEQARLELVSAGQMFLYALLVILVTFLIVWFTFQINNFFAMFAWGKYLKIVLGVIFLASQLSLIVAATNISRAIRILEHSLAQGKLAAVIRRKPHRK